MSPLCATPGHAATFVNITTFKIHIPCYHLCSSGRECPTLSYIIRNAIESESDTDKCIFTFRMFFENWSRRSLSLTTWWGQQRVCERAPSSSKYLLKVSKVLLAQVGSNCRLGINFIHLYSYLIFAKAKNFLYRSRRVLMLSPIQTDMNIYFFAKLVSNVICSLCGYLLLQI